MIDICSCCKGYSSTSTRQVSIYSRYSFSKKLLVAITLVVIIAMFITPTEAIAVGRRRHKHSNDNKHWESINNHSPSKAKPPKTREDIFKKELMVILQKLKNTKSYFNYKKVLIPELIKEFRGKPPQYLPKVKFVDFHQFPQKRKSRTVERKYKCVIPKLHKSLCEYEALLNFYYQMELDFDDIYKYKRQTMLKDAIGRLNGTILTIEDSMHIVNMTVKRPHLQEIHLSTRVDASRCFELDYFAFRGYGNFLKNWITELRCLKRRENPTIKDICEKWNSSLTEKRQRKDSRNPGLPKG